MIETQTRLNILWLTNWYPNRFDNFNGDFIQRQAWAANLHNDVTVLAIVPSPLKKFEISFDKNKIIEIVILIPDSRNPVVRSFHYLKALSLGYKILKERQKNNFDLIHANIIGAASVLSYILSKFIKISFIITEHWSGSLASRKKPAYKFARFFARKAKAIIVLSKPMENLMRERGIKNNYFIVPNVVDADMFSMNKKHLSKTFKWLHVSSLKDDIKNVSGILYAISKIEKKNFRLDIIGGGGDDIKLEKLSAELELLNTHVFFHGIQTHDKIAEAMSQVDAFVMNSRRESFSCVIMEAMSCGLPILSTDVVGIADFITPDVGILIPSDDESALKDGMIEMMQNRNKYSGREIRNKIVETCSYESVGKQISKIYRK